ncbi:BatA domain-containing protein [Pelagicoccus sp. NFK12]|uniref:BatA domain-containing protein n=1 Tax=Pelagicoccus enzymogenes TaxID=2773457 RepID=A0A927F732_9BACT|nr:BatA domain-containing protein [Pelagicoccus enzymogenes]MBD5779437.1 BatA domain-containing protein [Pelagicoccus enzymogenes]
MSFLAPLFLVGLALVAGPILFHLIRQSPKNRIVFSSTELLDASPPKQQTSRRIQNPWLLLIRCLIIGFLAFAFARPFIPDAADTLGNKEVRRDIVIAIDRSASMNRPGISEQLMEEARKILEKLSPSDQLSLFGFTDAISPIISPEQWTAMEADRRINFALERLESSTATALPGLLVEAISEAVSEIEALRERTSVSGFGEIYLLSDFAEGTRINGIESIDWPSSLRLNRVQLSPEQEGPNLSLRWVQWSESESLGSVANIALTSSGAPLRSVAEISIRSALDDSLLVSPSEHFVDGNTETIINIPVAQELCSQPLVFALSGDSYPFDNKLALAPDYIPQVSIGLISQSSLANESSAPYFISKAVQGFATPRTRIDSQTPLAGSHVAYVIDRPLATAEANSIKAEIESGKTAIVLAHGTGFSDTIRQLSGSDSWLMENRSSDTPLLIGEVDFSHTLFAPFASPRFSNFTSINTWQTPKLSAPGSAKVLARYDDQSPLLVEEKRGDGSLYIWSGSWAPPASQWVLSSKFIPFLHRFVLSASGGPPLPSNAALTSSEIERYQPMFPDQLIQTPGIYRFPRTENRWLAIHIDPLESKTNPISLDQWEQLGLPEFEESVAQAQLARIRSQSEQESARTIEERQHIWQWLLWAVLALLALESAVAMRSHQRKEAMPS